MVTSLAAYGIGTIKQKVAFGWRKCHPFFCNINHMRLGQVRQVYGIVLDRKLQEEGKASPNAKKIRTEATVWREVLVDFRTDSNCPTRTPK